MNLTVKVSAWRVRGWVCAALVALPLAACARTDNAAITLAIVNARVWTGDSATPWAEAIAVSGEHISAVGTTAEIKAHLTEAARVIDAEGAMVTPADAGEEIFVLARFA